ncbi:Protein of unknown function [Lactobacillus helveticus CIRM-BIA 951]|uniref:Uncharacterized protein n=1 Tax=Lactobacillus helveticus CIRM-BIA 951 TaxID=1226334 RepID=U6F2F7_LACHE|nr:Protein of unknown function [Lactobacillus helveticus CIRM-BIA 951]
MNESWDRTSYHFLSPVVISWMLMIQSSS